MKIYKKKPGHARVFICFHSATLLNIRLTATYKPLKLSFGANVLSDPYLMPATSKTAM